MANRFLCELDQWTLGLLQEKILGPDSAEAPPITAADFALMLSDYVLFSVAESPMSCWTACELDFASDEAILRATSFTEEMLAAAFIGAVCELNAWDGDDGVRFMTAHGVPPEDAREIAAAVEVVSEKLGRRGQSLVQRLSTHSPRR